MTGKIHVTTELYLNYTQYCTESKYNIVAKRPGRIGTGVKRQGRMGIGVKRQGRMGND